MPLCRILILATALTGSVSGQDPAAASPEGAAFRGTTLQLNEILADPAPDASGDANGDGVRDSSDDEFVELINLGTSSIDLAGWSIRDSTEVRHVFPDSLPIMLLPGALVTVFGGGTPTGIQGLVFTASGGRFALNNDGDTVTLLAPGGEVRDRHAFGSEGGHDVSIVRVPDGLGGWVRAGKEGSIAPFSPGRWNTGVAAPTPRTWGHLKSEFDQQ